jgi:hypothetical protein
MSAHLTRHILENSLLPALMTETLVPSLLDWLVNSLALFYHLSLSVLALEMSRSPSPTFLDLFMP